MAGLWFGWSYEPTGSVETEPLGGAEPAPARIG